MLDVWAQEVFGWLCHQDPSRSFAPGDVVLAICARCVGVYAGFVLALPAVVVARHVSRTLGMWLHGGLVVQVAVFGFDLIPHGPTIRAISGQLFAVGVVYFLYMGIRGGRGIKTQDGGIWLLRSLLVVALSVVGLQLLLRLPWGWAATAANSLALAGLAVVCVMTAMFLGRICSVVLSRR